MDQHWLVQADLDGHEELSGRSHADCRLCYEGGRGRSLRPAAPSNPTPTLVYTSRTARERSGGYLGNIEIMSKTAFKLLFDNFDSAVRR